MLEKNSSSLSPSPSLSYHTCEQCDKANSIDFEDGLVSIIIPIHNEEDNLVECLESIITQTFTGTFEVIMYNDCSTDSSQSIIEKWVNIFREKGVSVKTGLNDGIKGRGCGFAKNRGVELSTGEFLCFQDADDVMLPDRIKLQVTAAISHPNAIIGGSFDRYGVTNHSEVTYISSIPEGSTHRYSAWANGLSQEELWTHRFRDVTVIHPTWFMKRKVWFRVGGYDESFPNCPEDLIFFYQHIDHGGTLYKVPNPIIKYRHHEGSTCKSIHRLTLLKVRVEAWERQVGIHLKSFSIWGVGRDGKKFFNTLSKEMQEKVQCFGDIDEKKIGSNYYNAETKSKKVTIVHFDTMSKCYCPFVTCVALDRSGRAFEQNLNKMVAKYNLKVDRDYFYFM